MNLKQALRPALAPALLALAASAVCAGPSVTALPVVDVPVTVTPMTLPSMPIQIPNIGGPLTRLPSPISSIPTLPGAVISLPGYLPATASKENVFSAAQKSFAGKDGKAPSAAKLNAAFDNAKAEKAAAADEEDEPEVKAPAKRKGDPSRLTLPEYDLLTEIGIR